MLILFVTLRQKCCHLQNNLTAYSKQCVRFFFHEKRKNMLEHITIINDLHTDFNLQDALTNL